MRMRVADERVLEEPSAPARGQIEADPERDFGSAVRSTPKMEGFGLVGWGVPAVMLLVGAWWVTRWIRRRVVAA